MAVKPRHGSIGNCKSNSTTKKHFQWHMLMAATICFNANTQVHPFTSRSISIKSTMRIFASQKDRDDVSIDGSTKNRRRRQKKRRPASTFSTAVCIVPPDEAWDSIQRARHLARDTSFYKWPPAIRLFHPFAPKSEIPSHVGKLAEWIDEEALKFELCPESDDLFPFFSPFEVTLDSLQILPHWEVLDARIDVQKHESPYQGLGETLEEKRFRAQKEASQLLIEGEAKKGITRKKEREKKEMIELRRQLKRELKQYKNEMEMGINRSEVIEEVKNELRDVQTDIDRLLSLDDEDQNEQENKTPHKAKSNNFDGPCVIYLSPNEESCIALRELREKLRTQLFLEYDSFSPSSSVSTYPEFLPRKSEAWRPLLPISRFPSVKEAVKMAKVLQKSWYPLEFNVTDIQFISRNDDDFRNHNIHQSFEPGTGFGRSAKKSYATHSIGVTTSGEVEDVSKQGVFGCDAMVMLLGEEPEEEFMEDDATLSMLVPEDADKGDSTDIELDGETQRMHGSNIDYNSIFTNAEREYQRMKSHEELSSAEFLGDVPIFSSDDDLEKWLDTDDSESDEGATAVLGRAQFFMGAMREFVGMPVSSVIDYKERIMGSGVNSAARKKGSRNIDGWDDDADDDTSTKEPNDLS